MLVPAICQVFPPWSYRHFHPMIKGFIKKKIKNYYAKCFKAQLWAPTVSVKDLKLIIWA